MATRSSSCRSAENGDSATCGRVSALGLLEGDAAAAGLGGGGEAWPPAASAALAARASLNLSSYEDIVIVGACDIDLVVRVVARPPAPGAEEKNLAAANDVKPSAAPGSSTAAAKVDDGECRGRTGVVLDHVGRETKKGPVQETRRNGNNRGIGTGSTLRLRFACDTCRNISCAESWAIRNMWGAYSTSCAIAASRHQDGLQNSPGPRSMIPQEIHDLDERWVVICATPCFVPTTNDHHRGSRSSRHAAADDKGVLLCKTPWVEGLAADVESNESR